MGKWVQLNSASSATVGPPGPPGPSGGTPAPNITSATLAVSFIPFGNGQQFVFGGVITLPTGSPDYSHLKQIDVVAVDPNNQSFLVTRFTGWSGSTIAYSGTVTDQPTTDQVWSCQFICYNEVGAPTPSPYTISSINVYAAAIASLSGAEVSGARYQDVLQGLHTVIQYTVSLGHSQYPQNVTFWNDFDDGRGFIWQGWFPISSPSQVIRIGDPVSIQGQQQPGDIWVPPPGQTSWVVKAFPGAIGGGSTPIPAGATSAAFTVGAVGQCLPGDVTQAAFNPNPSSGDILNYYQAAVGLYYWDYYQLQFFQPSLSTDPNYWFTFVTVQKGYGATGVCTISGGTTCTKTSGSVPFDATMVGEDIHVNGALTTIAGYTSPTVVTLTNAQPSGSGKPYEVWIQAPDSEGVDESKPYMLYRGRWFTDSGQFQGTVSIPNTFVYLNGAVPATWTIPPDKNPDGTPNPYRYYRFRLYCASHINDNALGNSTGYVLQTSAWAPNADGSQDHFDVAPLTQPPALDLTQAAQYGLGDALGGGNGVPVKVNIALPMYADISNNLNIKISNDFVVDGSGHLTQQIVDLAKAVNFDITQFSNGSGVYTIQALAVNKLIAGDALFAGQATFAYNGGGKLTINSSGLTLADRNVSPTSTATITSLGINLVKGNYTLLMAATGIFMTDGTGASLSMSSGVITLQKGSSSVTITSSSVSIVNGALSISGVSGFTVNIDNTNAVLITKGSNSVGLANATVLCANSSSGADAILGPNSLSFGSAFNSAFVTLSNGSVSRAITLSDDSGNIEITIGAGSGFFGGPGINLLLGAVYRVAGTQVVSSRVVTTPVTLADVIAVLQHHGLSN